MFKYSCLHFPPTLPPTPAISTSHLWSHTASGFVHVSFTNVPEPPPHYPLPPPLWETLVRLQSASAPLHYRTSDMQDPALMSNSRRDHFPSKWLSYPPWQTLTLPLVDLESEPAPNGTDCSYCFNGKREIKEREKEEVKNKENNLEGILWHHHQFLEILFVGEAVWCFDRAGGKATKIH